MQGFVAGGKLFFGKNSAGKKAADGRLDVSVVSGQKNGVVGACQTAQRIQHTFQRALQIRMADVNAYGAPRQEAGSGEELHAVQNFRRGRQVVCEEAPGCFPF